jgi:hypothetical protein
MNFVDYREDLYLPVDFTCDESDMAGISRELAERRINGYPLACINLRPCVVIKKTVFIG